MKKVGAADIDYKKMALPAGILTLSIFSAIAAGAGPENSKTTVTKVGSTSQAPSATQSPAPDASPEITINGVKIPTASPGRSEVTIPGGKAQVEVSRDQTNVTASSTDTPKGTTDISNGNVDIHIDSHSSTMSSSSRSSSSRSTSNTSVSSSSQSTVNISH